MKRSEAIADINAATARLRTQLEDLRRQRQEITKPLDEIGDEILATTDEDDVVVLQRRYDRLASDLSYELDLVRSQADATSASLASLDVQAQLANVGEARIIQLAAAPTASANAPLTLNLALGAVLGLISGFALALVAEVA